MWIILTLLSLFIVTAYPRCSQKIRIARWRNRLSLGKHEDVYTRLFINIDGFALSRAARLKQDDIAYVYGEIDFTSFVALLSLVAPNQDTIFYDLGSGTGKAAIACAMVYFVRKCVGVEILQSLHEVACDQQQQLSYLSDYSSKACNIQFINANFLQADIHDATLIFINATALFGETWVTLSQRIEKTTQCATVISTSKALKSSSFAITKVVTVQMSWGHVKAYIQTRIA